VSWISPAAGVGAIRPGWLRRNGLRWADVEPERGAGYRWDAPGVRALEAQLVAASQLGLRVILVVQGSPPWAVEPFRSSCAPVAAERRDDYARFVAAAVARYSAPPYNVRFWELGNEPDAFVVEGELPYGCWGRPDQPLYGGEAYGELLKVAYPAIKAADPSAVVFNGGLLLDRPYDPASGEGRSGRFLEGVLEAGAGASFDVLAYHSYSFFDGTPDGGATQDWKPAYLRGILARYGVSKPLFNTEGALLCLQASPACAQAQAFAIPRLYARTLRDGVGGFVWYLYESDDFRSTALVEPSDPTQRRPAHLAFAQATAALDGLGYAGPLSGLPAGAEGHLLRAGRRAAAVLWANTPVGVVLRPDGAGPLACAEWDGAPLPCARDGAGRLLIEAGPGPRYVSWSAP
jgi:hypothetical protein